MYESILLNPLYTSIHSPTVKLLRQACGYALLLTCFGLLSNLRYATCSAMNLGCEHVQCKSEVIHEFYKNRIDPSSFCVCQTDHAIAMKCPRGMHFDPHTQFCRQYWDFGRDEDLKPTALEIQLKEILIYGCHEVCPVTTGSSFVLKPNRLYRGSFCNCTGGDVRYMECSAGLYFNAVTLICESDCGNPMPTTEDTIVNATIPDTTNNTGEVASTVNDDQPELTTFRPNGCEYVQCPAQNSQNALHLSNPLDCGSFCKCDWGEALHFKCPDGLHFNAVKQVCDWPEAAGCLST